MCGHVKCSSQMLLPRMDRLKMMGVGRRKRGACMISMHMVVSLVHHSQPHGLEHRSCVTQVIQHDRSGANARRLRRGAQLRDAERAGGQRHGQRARGGGGAHVVGGVAEVPDARGARVSILRDESSRVVNFDGATDAVGSSIARLRVPTLAIHLDRTVNDKLSINAETHLPPVLATLVRAKLEGAGAGAGAAGAAAPPAVAGTGGAAQRHHSGRVAALEHVARGGGGGAESPPAPSNDIQ
jgi:hypothetical protein